MEALNSTMSSLENNIGHVTEESYIVTSLGNTISDAMEGSDALTSLSNMSDVLPNETSLPYDARPETYIVPVVFALIFVVGVLGNGTLVYIFLRHRNMRNVPNTYIFSLALGDLLVIITCVPFTSTAYTVESWPFGETICKMSETAKDVSIGVSVFTLTALSADRFFAIVDPMRKLHTGGGGRRATRLTILVAGFIWVLALLCATPAVVNSYIAVKEVNKNFSFSICYPFPEEFGDMYAKLMVTARFFVYYFLPLSVIAVFYTLMARHLILSTRNMPGEMQGPVRQVRARKKVAKMVLTFVIMFAICFFPQHVFMLWFYYNPNTDKDYNLFWHIFRISGFCLSFINSCINPIALYCVSGAFRKHFNRYLLCFCSSPSARAREGTASHGRHASCSLTNSRRNIGTLTSSRRGDAANKCTWESTALGHFHNHNTTTPQFHNHNTTAKRQILCQPDEVTVTSCMNGGGGRGISEILNQ